MRPLPKDKYGVDVHKISEAALTSDYGCGAPDNTVDKAKSRDPHHRLDDRRQNEDNGIELLKISHTEITVTNRVGTKTVEVAKRPFEVYN